MAVNQEHVWAFDLGKGSIGEAVRVGHEFRHVSSLLIPAEFAETKTSATRRRMWRTRLAHRAREKWLNQVLAKSGIEPLQRRNYDKHGNWKAGELADPRLEREFAKPGDSTCYTSCLLRIRLLRGEKLEPWQVYKALHSAIQRRGYDPNIPWKTQRSAKAQGAATDQADEEEAGTQKRMEDFVVELKKMSGGREEFEFPCYYDAWQMGLWNPAQPEQLKERIDCQARSTRNQVVPRWLVEKEITQLIDATQKHFPKLQPKTKFILYGPAEAAYASHNPALRKKFGLKEGGANDWQGALGQKIPRFDNRIIGKCALIPRLNVCKIRSDGKKGFHPNSKLAAEVSFLMKLKNMRVSRAGGNPFLSANEIEAIFSNPRFHKLSITEAEWKKLCVLMLALPLPGHELVEAPKPSGRSRFCRPALDLLKRLILSGQSPLEFYECEVKKLSGNKDPMRGLVANDLKFIQRMGGSWEKIYIPNQKLDSLVQNADDRESAISALVGSQNDPIVRHRLGVFAERLKQLEASYGAPEAVALEFVREDFMGKKAKLAYNKFIKERAVERVKAREEAMEAGASERTAGFKLELLKSQQGICLYTGEGLVPTSLDDYCIDHIVPRAKGGPDAAINYILTKRQTNDDKGNRTPYEWLAGSDGWDAYVDRVRQRAGTLRNKKAQLLIAPDAEQLVDKYTALAETAWISKLAQAILDIQFGWKNGCDETSRKRVRIVSGGLTGKIRRKYGLNRILNPNAKDEEEAEEKNRDDDRHHALDAMVISFLPNWARDEKKSSFFKFPEGINDEFFAKEIADLVPVNIALEKAALEETIYGLRKLDGESFIVGREPLADIAVRLDKNKRVIKEKNNIETHRIVDKAIREAVETFLSATPNLTLENWDKWCSGFRLSAEGPRVAVILTKKSKADSIDEYKDLSKDESGQFRRGAKHRGYFIFEREGKNKKGGLTKTIEVHPVYVFESKGAVGKRAEEPGVISHGFFESGCLVRIEKEWEFRSKKYPAGCYICTSIWANKNAKLRHPRFGEIGPVGLRILLDAGFKGTDSK